MFACFIDFNKAFDNVEYWPLFSKLIDNDPSGTVINFLAFADDMVILAPSWIALQTLTVSCGSRSQQNQLDI